MAEFIIGPTGFALDVIGVREGEENGKKLQDCLVIPGGSQLNLAYGLTRLGHTVSVIGGYGNDPVGEICRQDLIQAGIDVSHMNLYEGDTYTAFVLTEPAIPRRTIFANRSGVMGACLSSMLRDCREKLPEIEGARYFGMLAVTPGDETEMAGYAELFKTARRLGLTTFLEPSEDFTQLNMKYLAHLFPWIDYFLPGRKELEVITGEKEVKAGAEIVRSCGCHTVICKMGARGCCVMTGGSFFHVPGFEVPVKDLTGAGDGFAAGFLHGAASGWNMLRAAEFANAYAASNIMEIGPRGGMFSEKTVRGRMKDMMKNGKNRSI